MTPPYNLTDARVVVTGGSRGIGNHIARAFAAAGARVVITGRTEGTLSAAADAINGTCEPIVCDQRDPQAIDRLAEVVLGKWDGIDILVNNAGRGGGGPMPEMTLEAWRQVIDTNLTGVFYTTRCFLPAMIAQQRGDIFIVGSMSGKSPDPGGSAYAAAKFGLRGFAQSLLYDVRRKNVRVMVVNPSATATGADEGPAHGPGIYLHAADIAATLVHLARLPGRTLFRDMDVWGTNPFPREG